MKSRPLALLFGAVCLGFFPAGACAGTLTLDLTESLPEYPRYSGHAGTGTFGPDIAGLQNFNVSGQSGNAFAFPFQLQLFCIELAQSISLKSTGNLFEVVSADQGSGGGPFSPLGDNIPHAGIGATRAGHLEVLYAHKFGTVYNPGALSDTEKLGFQLAVWELSHDDNFNLLAGSGNEFWVTSPVDAAVTEAQTLVSWVAANAASAPKMTLYALHGTGDSALIQDFLVPIPEPAGGALLAGLIVLVAARHRRGRKTT